MTSAFAAEHGVKDAATIGPVARPQAIAAAAEAPDDVRAAVDEARAEAKEAQRNILDRGYPG